MAPKRRIVRVRKRGSPAWRRRADTKVVPMKTGKFAKERIAFALKRAGAGTKVEAICRKPGIGEWRGLRYVQIYG